jgi:hypothetical protein
MGGALFLPDKDLLKSDSGAEIDPPGITTMTPRRPLLLYLMLLAFVLLAIVNCLQWVQAVQSASWLKIFGYFPSPIYAVFEGFFFMLLFMANLISLWFRMSFAPRLGGLSLAVYVGWSWINRLWLTTNPIPFVNQLFALGVSLILLLLAEFSLFLLEPFMHRGDVMREMEEKND